MIPHEYKNASDNLAQFQADKIGRQEVTVDWYLEFMCDEPLFLWTSDEDFECGLDPWRLLSMVPDRPCRLFVQNKDIPWVKSAIEAQRQLGDNPR